MDRRDRDRERDREREGGDRRGSGGGGDRRDRGPVNPDDAAGSQRYHPYGGGGGGGDRDGRDSRDSRGGDFGGVRSAGGSRDDRGPRDDFRDQRPPRDEPRESYRRDEREVGGRSRDDREPRSDRGGGYSSASRGGGDRGRDDDRGGFGDRGARDYREERLARDSRDDRGSRDAPRDDYRRDRREGQMRSDSRDFSSRRSASPIPNDPPRGPYGDPPRATYSDPPRAPFNTTDPPRAPLPTEPEFVQVRASRLDGLQVRAFVPEDAEGMAFARAQRQGYGTLGRSIKLLVNVYGMAFPGSDCYHYDVEITPEAMPPFSRKIIAAWQRSFVQGGGSTVAELAAYDGRKNLYTPRPLGLADEENGSTLKLLIDDDRKEPSEYHVKIRQVAVVDMARLDRFINRVNVPGTNQHELVPTDALQVLDVLLKMKPSLLFNAISKSTGGSFYPEDGRGAVNISGGLAVHKGWKQTIRPTYKSLLMNMDVAVSSFYQPGPLLNVVAGFFGKRNIDDLLRDSRTVNAAFNPQSREFRDLQSFLKKVTVTITYRAHGRTKYKIKSIHRTDAKRTDVTVDSVSPPKQMSVDEYFKESFNITLRYPNLPVIEAGKNVYIPMELLTVKPGQRHLGKLNETQTADIIKITAVPPKDRRERIEDGRSMIHSEQSHVDLLAAWGVHVDKKMKEVDARILPPPTLSVSSERGPSTLNPRNGTFDISRGREGYYKSATIDSYGIAVLGGARCSARDVEGFVESILNVCRNKGMGVPRRGDGLVVNQGQERMSVEAALAAANDRACRVFGTRKAQIVFCVMDKGGALYDEIKYFAETRLGLMTQCFFAKHVQNSKPGVAANLALKVNAKLGGINYCVDPKTLGGHDGIDDGLTMFIGADVTLPPPRSDGPSVIAVVGSVDPQFCEYRAAIRVQPKGTVINQLGSTLIELLRQFEARNNGQFPKRIVFFRGGVSDGQVGEVGLQEISNLKHTIRELGLVISVTYIIVNKRHGIRFFPDPRDADRKGNVLEGTVVDSGITHPYEFDFYLNSHPGLQGTSRSAHYNVVYDENKFTSNGLQEMTYKMCYLYARSTRAVSVIPPVYYASLVAARARSYKFGSGGFSDTASSTTGGGGGASRLDDLGEVVQTIRDSMYFT